MKLTLTVYGRSFEKNESKVYFRTREALKENAQTSFLQLFNNYAQALFNYGMLLCADEPAVKSAIQVFFIDLKKNEIPSSYCSKNNLYKNFRDLLSCELSRTKNSPLIPVAESTPSNLGQLSTEATFLRLKCGFTYEEVAAIMSVRQESVYHLVHHALIKNGTKKETIPCDE